MLYTAQAFADNGTWAAPGGRESLHFFSNREEVNGGLDDWADIVGRYDDREDAYLMVWCSEHHSDVTDEYPDFKVSYGPRGGIRWESV